MLEKEYQNLMASKSKAKKLFSTTKLSFNKGVSPSCAFDSN